MLPPHRARRAAGLLAAGTLGLSTVFLGAIGTAQAGPTGWTFSESNSPITVPSDVCSIEWTITGGAGGFGDTNLRGQNANPRIVTTVVAPGDQYTLVPGGAGADHAAGGQGGTNTVGQGGGANGDIATGGGGGGAASLVLKNGQVFLSSLAGFGGGAGGGAGGHVPDSPSAAVITDFATTPAPGVAGPGSITGQGYACEALNTPPPAPEISVVPGPGQLSVWGRSGGPLGPGPGVAPVTGYEYSLDGGPWTTVPGGATHGMATPLLWLTGLVNGREYGVSVRVTSSAGPSAASAVKKTTPFERPGKPTGVSAKVGPSELTISWSPTAAPGTYPLTGYQVWAFHGDEVDGFQVYLCEVSASVHTCTAEVPAGVDYAVYVEGVDDKGNVGDYGWVNSAVVPLGDMPATVPAKDADLVGASGPITTVTAGKTVVLKGSGYMPNSTIRAIAYSTPTELGVFVTDENGEFEVTVTIPGDLPAGAHSLVVTGVDPQGDVRHLRVDVTVSASGTATVTEAALATTATATATATERLPNTGFSAAGPLVAGTAALGLGAGLIVASRRRPSA
ncbi:LPXTG cell wall anchor domain-containing protein [Blastococcus mobilis]|uniref:LPXTG-motif cell wall anchor domain-containing protein n=1 Tax=Blastococcus mobilis TaxID=1938746 RepID=A0A238WJ66_9ACTN|nr:LPXTG cell wall anchor domain-containing protein [Blastococcus mobilis]SNR46363.1 LPXTG-motif cell wall anchor domain-containing protein [Blastococcus mobilis]